MDHSLECVPAVSAGSGGMNPAETAGTHYLTKKLHLLHFLRILETHAHS